MTFFKQLSLQINYIFKSLFFLQYIPHAFFYSLKRDRFERQYLPDSSSESVTQPGKLLRTTATERGAYFYFEQAELEISFLTPDLVRVNWSPDLPPVPYAVVNCDWDRVETNLAKLDNNWAIASDALSVTVGIDGSLTFCDRAGQVLRTELPPQRQGERWVHRSQLRSEERIYGLGERASSLNLRAAKDDLQKQKTYQMWNRDPGGRYAPGTDPIYICIPVYLGLHDGGSYLIFYENSFRAEFTFADMAIGNFAGGSLRYYMTIGEPSQLLECYTQLTGRPSLPPRWALGYHQSRWGYRTEANVRQEVKAFQTYNLPLSAVHLDIDCQVEHRAFTIDPERFPKIDSFTQELAETGVRLIAINNPGIKSSRKSNLFLEGQVLNGFCTYPTGELAIASGWAGAMAFPDFTNPKVRAWWSRQYAYLLDVGVAGFWHDMNEPAAFVSWGDPSLPQVAQHCLEGRGGDHREAHNVYGLLEAQAAYESIRQYRPQQRPFIVSRSGWAGLQRYAWTWTGDTISTWEALRQTVATVVGLGISGIPYSGPDIGGFQGNPTAELYVRWFQMATFLMFCRTHSSTSVAPRTPWTYGEPYLSIVRSFLQLRYRLMPYFYTLAWETSQKGYPPVRPLFWFDWGDRFLWDVEDAFYLGEALLVCPIVREGERSRTLYLPQGYWYNFWDDSAIAGGQTIELDSPLEQIPLLVKAGSILPMEDSKQLILHLYPPVKTAEERGTDSSLCAFAPNAALRLRLMRDQNSYTLYSYTLYTDAGDGYGESRCDRFSLTQHEDSLELTWEQQGNYDFPYQSVQLHVHGVSLQQAWVDDRETTLQGQQLQCHVFKKVRFRCG
ncbi:MAG: Oligosaccharide 4-alpha-D-glucosyltransferase [Chroococcidiopsis sp. SAG 2025]|uniref:glycoside hydrolase family 31 protein n=1 Tax=Chroococcidiopsis sp. SAG 2025 TaxID=171389 RepID=UPI002936F19B|nr:glycoside hydrolase family 31 protein [Chroococcidiopsis sp. SAG 2025]MDV2994543.1 Oligosaccharide 4-alpha-D-glucosyltransferase [Chroococcidiopsis sp. SAG 2025]